jgi:hypothetical protein
MTSRDLHPDQTHKLMAIVGHQLRFANRLCDRMQRLGFQTQDPLWRAAIRAQEALQGLYMASHYAGCRSGLGLPATEEQSSTQGQ